MRKFFFFILLFTLISCDSIIEETPVVPMTKLDILFLNGFEMKLEQVYLMNGENSIPYFDMPKDSAFKSANSIVKIEDFVSFDSGRSIMLGNLCKNEKWIIGEMDTIFDTIYVEHGSGSNYTVTRTIQRNFINSIHSSNQFIKRNFNVNISLGSDYNYRGQDNHVFNVKTVVAGIAYASNLYFEILTWSGLGLFDNDEIIYLDTNPILSLVRQINPPLSSDNVKDEIEKGNYQLYIYDGMTTYQIGNNLYIPFFNSYVFVGTINTNGMIINYESKYYRFKFRILKTEK